MKLRWRNATSGYEICLTQEWLQRLVKNHCQHIAKWVRWGMLPLTMKYVRGKSSSSAVLRFTVGHVCLLKLRWGMLPRVTKSRRQE